MKTIDVPDSIADALDQWSNDLWDEYVESSYCCLNFDETDGLVVAIYSGARELIADRDRKAQHLKLFDFLNGSVQEFLEEQLEDMEQGVELTRDFAMQLERFAVELRKQVDEWERTHPETQLKLES